MTYYILDNNKEPISVSLREYYDWMHIPENRRVNYTVFNDGTPEQIIVSTVFLGLDHNFRLDSSFPILFETMIFCTQRGELDSWQDRYSTYDEAQKGHCRAVQLVTEKLKEIK